MIASATLGFKSMVLYSHRAEFEITVHDDYQDLGLGTTLTRYMIDIARERGIKKVDIMVMSHNDMAIRVYERLGFMIEGHLKMNHFNNVLND